jgi:hypothetical protein
VRAVTELIMKEGGYNYEYSEMLTEFRSKVVWLRGREVGNAMVN